MRRSKSGNQFGSRDEIIEIIATPVISLEMGMP